MSGIQILLGLMTSSFVLAAAVLPPRNFDLPPPRAEESWVPGVDYIILADMHIPGGYVPAEANALKSVQMKTDPGKVAVTYFFQYTWSLDLERAMKRWAENRPNVQYTHHPSVGWAHTRIFARMHYTLQTLGHGIETHFKLYEWVWEPEHDPTYYGNPLLPDTAGINRLNREFAKSLGINDKKFLSIYESPEMIFASDLAAHNSHTAGSGGMPANASIVINGAYATSWVRVCHQEFQTGQLSFCADPQDRLLRLIAYLVDAEVQRMRAPRPGASH